MRKNSRAELNVNNTGVSSEDLGDNAQVVEADLSMVKISRSRIEPISTSRDDFRLWLSHPVKIQHLNWTTTLTGETKITGDLIGFWKAALPTAMQNKISSLFYFRSTIRIRVVVQGAAQAYGQLVLTFCPKVIPIMGMSGAPLYIADNVGANVKVMPHIVIDPSKNDTYEIDLPVCTPTGWYQLGGTNYHGSYNFVNVVINKLRYGTANAPTGGINVCVYMSLLNPEFEGKTTVLSGNVKSEHKMSNILGTVSTLSGLAAPMSGPLAPTMTVISEAAGTASNVLRWFGYAKPLQGDANAMILNRTADNYSSVEGTSTAVSLGCSQQQTLAISPEYGAGMMEEMSIDYIASKWGLVNNDIAITTASAVETYITSCPVTCQIKNANLLQETPMSGVSLPAFSWIGDIDFRFEFVASAFTRATLLIAWDPYFYANTLQPTFADALTRLQNVTVQVVGNTCVEITVPYKSYMPSLAIVPTSYSTGNSGTEASTNGMILVYVVNPVVDNGGDGIVGMNVYARSRNLALFGAVSTQISGVTYANTTVLSSGEDIVPATQIDFGGRTSLKDVQFRLTGDMIKSVRDYSVRMGTLYETGWNLGGQSTWIGMRHVSMATPFIAGSNNPPSYSTFFTYLLPAFVGYRGGTKWSAYAQINGDDNPVNTGYVQRQLVDSASVGTIAHSEGRVLSSGMSTNCYAWSTVNLKVASRVDYVAPMVNMIDFQPARISTQTGGFKDAIHVKMAQTTEAVAGQGVNVTLAQGSSDDVTFCWFVGFPVRST